MNPYREYMEKVAINRRLAGRILKAVQAEKANPKGFNEASYQAFDTLFSGKDRGIVPRHARVNRPLFLGDAKTVDDVIHNGGLNRKFYSMAGQANEHGNPNGFVAIPTGNKNKPATNLQRATADQLDKTMMTGRHKGKDEVFTIPKSYDKETGVTSGRGLHDNIAYRGVGGLEGKEKDFAPNTRRWVTGIPEVASSYANNASVGQQYISVHDLDKLQKKHRATGWSNHIAMDVGGGPFADTKAKLIGKISPNAGRADWGTSPIYEKVIDHSDLLGTETSRLKRLPSGRGYQQVKGDYTAANHPLNQDSGASHQQVKSNPALAVGLLAGAATIPSVAAYAGAKALERKFKAEAGQR